MNFILVFITWRLFTFNLYYTFFKRTNWK